MKFLVRKGRSEFAGDLEHWCNLPVEQRLRPSKLFAPDPEGFEEAEGGPPHRSVPSKSHKKPRSRGPAPANPTQWVIGAETNYLDALV